MLTAGGLYNKLKRLPRRCNGYAVRFDDEEGHACFPDMIDIYTDDEGNKSLEIYIGEAGSNFFDLSDLRERLGDLLRTYADDTEINVNLSEGEALWYDICDRWANIDDARQRVTFYVN